MSRYAQIEDGLVVNILLWDGEEPYPDEGLIQLEPESPVGIGWERVDGEWVAPPAEDVEILEV